MILLIIFLVIRFLRKRYLMPYVNRRAQDSGGGPERGEERSDGEEMVLDPVCDSYIPLSTAITAQTPSGTEYFCSTECRARFAGQ